MNQAKLDEILFNDFTKSIQPFTMVDRPRLHSLFKAVQYIVRAGIQGDFVECGVYRGGCCMLMALTLLSLGDTSRKIYLYDTFAGMPEPGALDVSGDENKDAQHIWSEQQQDDHNEWCYAPLDQVQRNLSSTTFPTDRLVFVQGKTEDTIPHTIPEGIALLRLDTDWYNSTRHEMEHLYPKLAPNGVLISDDYAHWAGHRKAIDDYLAEKAAPLLLTPVSCGAIGVKPVLDKRDP